MKVRVTKARRDSYWYANKIGQEFEVVRAAGLDYHVVDIYHTGDLTDTGSIWLTDAEIVEEDKIVEHDGVKYKVPSYAAYLARDSAGKDVFFFENKPIWYNARVGWAHPEDNRGRVGIAEVYIEPLPEGNFIVAI